MSPHQVTADTLADTVRGHDGQRKGAGQDASLLTFK